ncbi:IclR family transcriptional regulator [Brevundimonas lutea]|uniref:IclR family transcriptional regulator n=1 Tax=Brevundimonas lutea TaxID=2293980 RepID=UPI000F03C62C|nr:helix-turn-helix domain-containing protein [Brevundimonas lutea]
MADDTDDDRKYRAPALEKGLDILEMLAERGRPMTPSQMSALLGRSVSELFRMIQVLEFRGYIEPSADGYRLTNRLFQLGMAQAPIKSIIDVALPVMRDVTLATGQSCHLVVPSEDQIVVVARIEAPGDLGYSVRVGYRRPIIDATSGLMMYGKASDTAKAALRARLEPLHGERRVKVFVEEAEAAAAEGHARRPSDFVRGVTDVVAPVMGVDGIIATLICPHIERLPKVCDLDAVPAILIEGAGRISREMTAASQA